ncbi:MAG: Fe-S cluster assembly protein SufD [Streptococcaceae bacterium]|jgi:Fe-S cluster assembly protein SufD|nr:Fe-S cluster assembly protein SufD [Streptococcaceae bacterium]
MSNLEAIQSFSAVKGEPSWMSAKRQKAFEVIDQLALPVIERVRYHRWPLFDGDFAQEDELIGNVADFSQLSDNPLVVQNGAQTVLEQLPQELIEQGVIFTDIFTAMREHESLVQKYFMTTALKADEDKLSAWHQAYFNSGVFLYIPKNVEVTLPIEAIFYQNSYSKTPFNKHVLIVAEENSKLEYLERFQTAGGGDVQISANIVVEVIAKNGARVKFSAVDRLGKNVTTFISRRGHVLKDAMIDWALGVMNDGNVIADFDSDLVGNGAHAELKAVAISTGKQVQGIDTRVTNFGQHSIGHILQHGVILEAGTLTFNGIGHIIRGAKGADAQQESRVLMLSDKARSDANPILLIDENEVTAGHAASIGRVDPEELYYLMSRGIPQHEAERLVIRGFLGAVITAIPLREVQEEFIEVIEKKLAKGH